MKYRLYLFTLILSAMLIVSCGGEKGSGGSTLDCSVFPDQDSSQYILPWEIGDTFLASPHSARDDIQGEHFYAVDFPMPIGTPIVASRDGVVVSVEEQFVDGDSELGHENVIVIEHEDLTLSRYFHLTNNGALVAVGDSVLQLEQIGFSGNTGNSTGPHLHFDVTDEFCDPVTHKAPDGFSCHTLPLTFLNTRAQDCGLIVNESYTALAF